MGLKPRTDRRIAASSMPPASFDNTLRLLREGTRHALDAKEHLLDFVARAWRLVQHVRSEPVLAGHFDDLCEESEMADRQRSYEYHQLLRELVEVRQMLEAKEPALFDYEEPEDQGARSSTHWYFDEHVKAVDEGRTLDFTNWMRLGQFIGSLQSYLERAESDVENLATRLRGIRDEERLSFRLHRLSRNTASHSALWLRRNLSPLDRQPENRGTWEDALSPVARLLDTDERNLDKSHVRQLNEDLPRHLERLEAELRARIGTVRSRLALFERFRQRAQCYDRERLREIAQGATREAEQRLTHELAVFLFDSGLNPLTEVTVDNNRLDILDPPGRVYVEAKQYSSSASARADIVHGVNQIASGFQKLAGTPLEVHEGFLAVFRWDREGGPVPPLYELPRELRLGRRRIYPLLIDLASSAASGRNAGTAVQLAEMELVV